MTTSNSLKLTLLQEGHFQRRGKWTPVHIYPSRTRIAQKIAKSLSSANAYPSLGTAGICTTSCLFSFLLVITSAQRNYLVVDDNVDWLVMLLSTENTYSMQSLLVQVRLTHLLDRHKKAQRQSNVPVSFFTRPKHRKIPVDKPKLIKKTGYVKRITSANNTRHCALQKGNSRRIKANAEYDHYVLPIMYLTCSTNSCYRAGSRSSA